VRGGTRYFSRRTRTRLNDARRVIYKPFSQSTVDLADRVVAILRDRGSLGQSEAARILGVKMGAVQNLLVYLAEKRADVAEDDRGRLIYIGEENHGKET
jgi:hypothetical protein